MKQLGKYEIIELLGSGATADVYRAHDESMGRDVALKVFKPALVADALTFARFVQEAQAAAGLFHENIATALDSGEIDGNFFIAMRYVPGQSLDRLLKEGGALPWDEALRLTQQIGSALMYAHEHGFLHRDVKPANIVRSNDGNYVLTDFGLAKAMFSSGLTTHTGAVLGTPSYIPPEIWEGQEASAATDVYALACVLYEALTGGAFFTGATPPAVMSSHFRERHFPAQWPAGVPDGVDALLAKALAVTPQSRISSVAEFTLELTRLGASPKLKGEVKAPVVKSEPGKSTTESVQRPAPQPVQTPPVQQVKPPAPKTPRKRKTWLWILLGLLALAMFVCLILPVLFNLLTSLMTPAPIEVPTAVPLVVQESQPTMAPLTGVSVPATQTQLQPTLATVTTGASLEVVDQLFYTDLNGDVVVYGLVKNISNQAVASMELTIEAKDASGVTVLKNYDGNVLETDAVFVMTSILFPGDTAPFTYFIDGDNGVPVTVNVVATGSITSDENRVNVTTENVEYYISNGSYYISGELVNNSSSWATVEGLAAAIFDGSGKIVAASSISAYSSCLAPNGDKGGMDRTPFAFIIYGLGGDYRDYKIYRNAVETSDPLTIPEINLQLLNSYFDDLGSFHVIGTLENSTDVPYSVYLVTGLIAENGAVLDAVSHTNPLYVPAGAKVAFDSTDFNVVGRLDDQTDKLKNYSVQLDPYWTCEASRDLVTPHIFSLTEARDRNNWSFSGELTNDTGVDLNWMTLQVNIYDGETLVGTDYYFMYPEGESYAAGSKASYDLTLQIDPSLSGATLTYEIVTQGVGMPK